jgi:predicted phage terminase large subunit-like protein
LTEKERQIAKRGREDLFYFCKHVLSYTKMEPDPHQELCTHVEKSARRKKLILMPRNSYKSSVITVGASMHFLLRNPDERILIASETQKNAVRYANEIKLHYENNQKFRRLYGAWDNAGHTWRAGELIVKPRKAIKKEASITTGSLEKGVLVGAHFSKIILDDVVSRSNTQNPEQIAKTLEFYKLLLSILDPDGQIYVVGTRWNYLDLYGYLQSDENPERDQFDVFARKADDGEGKVIGTPLMPKILSKEFLEEQLAAQGESVYSHQYRNLALSSEEQVFKPEWVKFYNTPPQGLYHFMTVDPAISLEQGADSTGIIVNGCDYKNNWYVREAIQRQMRPQEILDLIFALADQYQPIYCLGLQKFHLEKFLKINLQEEMLKRKLFIPIKDLYTDTRISKEYRVRALQPRFQNGQVFIKKEHRELYNQLVMYPQVQHDDVLDALQMQLQITFPSDVISDAPEQEDPLHKLSLAHQQVWEGVRALGKRRVVQKKWREI